MAKMNFFAEGIQGAGKSTLVSKLAEEHPDFKVFREGDYSPVELVWCAFVGEDEYQKIRNKYPGIYDIITEKTVQEEDKKVIPYTHFIDFC